MYVKTFLQAKWQLKQHLRWSDNSDHILNNGHKSQNLPPEFPS